MYHVADYAELDSHFGGEIFDDGDSNRFSENENAVQQLLETKSPESPVPILRKDFPETWIWNEINEEG